MKYLFTFAVIIALTGCNSMYIKPDTLDPTQPIYTVAGGYSMKRSIKERMDERGYNIFIGKMVSAKKIGTNDGGNIDIDEYKFENVRYVVNVSERNERFAPIWCIFNGFWWWNFNVSIGDQKTGEEIFTWRGRGCQNSSLRKLDDALDELEMTPVPVKNIKWQQRIDTVKPG